MTESTSVENLKVLEGSMEQLNVETSAVESIVKDDLNDDPIDFWCEDRTSRDVSDDELGHSSALDREWQRRHHQFHTMGYRDGITAGQEASAQEGFNVGFNQSVLRGFNWGLVRGITSTLSNLPDQLKEKLLRTGESRERFKNLYESAQTISASDALRIFHSSIQHVEAKQAHDFSEGSSGVVTMTDEDFSCNQLDGLSKELVSLLHDCPEIDLNIKTGKEISG